jgi:hypothetical protein
MPSREHDVLVDMVRGRPELVPRLLRHAGLPVLTAPVTVVDATFSVAASVSDFHVDLAVVVGDVRTPRLVVLLEVQLSIDPDKPHRWLLYQAAAQDRHRCDVAVLVLTPDAGVARWARRGLPVGRSATYAPHVLGPRQLRALALASQDRPELVVLGALALDPRRPDRRLLRAAGEAIASLDDDDRVKVYLDVLEARLGEVFLAAVEGIMIRGEPLSDRAKGYYRAGEARALLAFLDARGLAVTSEQRDAILACHDLERLERWIARAATAQSVAEVFAR